MYGILGEDQSDVATLAVLVRRLACNDGLRVLRRGFDGCGQMLRKGARELRAFQQLNCRRFIVCHDADGPDPGPARRLVREKVVAPARLGDDCCIVVPVQELEAWILADIECATRIFTSWQPSSIQNPEAIESPKEHLEKLSRQGNHRPRYSHATHNERMAKYLDLDRVARKCPSFRVLSAFVRAG